MDIKKLYALEGENISQAIGRFMGNEEMYFDFLTELFTEDETFENLASAVSEGDEKKIETEAHTLKGAAANMGLDALSKAAGGIVQAVRGGNASDIPALFDSCSREYDKVRTLVTEE